MLLTLMSLMISKLQAQSNSTKEMKTEKLPEFGRQ